MFDEPVQPLKGGAEEPFLVHLENPSITVDPSGVLANESASRLVFHVVTLPGRRMTLQNPGLRDAAARWLTRSPSQDRTPADRRAGLNPILAARLEAGGLHDLYHRLVAPESGARHASASDETADQSFIAVSLPVRKPAGNLTDAGRGKKIKPVFTREGWSASDWNETNGCLQCRISNRQSRLDFDPLDRLTFALENITSVAPEGLSSVYLLFNGYGTPEPVLKEFFVTKTGAAPVIRRFYAERHMLAENEKAVLHWEVSGPGDWMINQGAGLIDPMLAEYSQPMSESVDFTLGLGLARQPRKTVPVYVLPPAFKRFELDGDRLCWDSVGAVEITGLDSSGGAFRLEPRGDWKVSGDCWWASIRLKGRRPHLERTVFFPRLWRGQITVERTVCDFGEYQVLTLAWSGGSAVESLRLTVDDGRSRQLIERVAGSWEYPFPAGQRPAIDLYARDREGRGLALELEYPAEA